MCACVGISGQQIFINIPLFTLIYALLSFNYYDPGTRSSVNICHIILTPVTYSLSLSLLSGIYVSAGDLNPLSLDPEALSWTKHVDQTSVSGL